MTKEERLRLRCLELAMQASFGNAPDLKIKAAKDFYDFIAAMRSFPKEGSPSHERVNVNINPDEG